MKFGIDLGHGVGPDRGAVGKIAEETIINDVGNLVISKLKDLGHTVIELRPNSASSVQDSLQQRYSKSDYYNVDMCVSIHANAGGGVGTEVFTYKAKEVPQAVAVLNNIVNLGFRNRGIKDGNNLAMIKRPKATSMLIEICFVDSNDSNLYKSIGAEKIADAIVNGLTGEKVVETVSNSTGGTWIQDNKGWWYKHADETYTKQDFEQINGEWYYFDYKGYMVTGWLHLTSNNQDYYFYSDGKMAHDCELWGTWRFDSNGHGTKLRV